MTFNLNGIRSAANKGFFTWLEKQNADIICFQETKAQEHQLSHAVFSPSGYHAHYFDAEKKGYSGVAILSKKKPDKIIRGLGFKEADTEGRYIQADFGDLSVASIYFPSGTMGPVRQTVKYDFMARYEVLLKKQRANAKQFILCGDWNIAHKEIDLKNWKANQNYTGFLPEERAWLDKVFGELDYVDAFRVVNQNPEQYTWWSNRPGVWERNVGWRIDYQIVSSNLKDKILSAEIYRGEKFSDHAPLTMEYNLDL